jgi:hypothetical protein
MVLVRALTVAKGKKNWRKKGGSPRTAETRVGGTMAMARR